MQITAMSEIVEHCGGCRVLLGLGQLLDLANGLTKKLGHVLNISSA